MKAIKSVFAYGTRRNLQRDYTPDLCGFLFSLLFVLAACPVMGQANNGIQGHMEGDRLFLEVAQEALEKPMLFVKHGTGHHQIIWSKQRGHLILKVPRIPSLSGVVIPINQDYKTESLVLGRFPIVGDTSLNKSYRIDATDLFLTAGIKWFKNDVEEKVIPDRSFVEGVHHLERETIIQTKHTTLWDNTRRTKDVDFSFYGLPEPMEPRGFDHRMGFSIEDKMARTSRIGSIIRWRLEKKGGYQGKSDPVEPITFYFDPKMPKKWKPYVKAGIMEWSPAFEAAGFTNAIKVRDLPQGNGEKYPNSMNFSMVRWENYAGIRGGEDKSGSTVDVYVDLRSGEILKSDIILASSYQNLSDEYFVRCAPLDKRTERYPFPDDLMGELIQFVTAHEAGHAFGLQDGNHGEYAYPFDNIRDVEWLKTMGHTPSVMTYSRHNYIAQPEDGISPLLLIQKVGPMDSYQIKWGYGFPDEKKGGGKEKNTLEHWVRMQDSLPWYRYNRNFYNTIGPGIADEVADNTDPIRSTVMGLRNIQRVLELLPKVNQGQPDNVLLKRLYNKTVNLWYREMVQVLSLIGGYTIQQKSGSMEGDVFSPIGPESQMEALDFLMAHALDVPDWLCNPGFLYRIQYSNNGDALMEAQLKLLYGMIDPHRMKRLEFMESKASHGDLSKDILFRIRSELFRELREKEIHIGQRRQKLQRAYIGLLIRAIAQELNYVSPTDKKNWYMHSDYSKSQFLSELLVLQDDMENVLDKVGQGSTQAHLRLCAMDIKKMMEP